MPTTNKPPLTEKKKLPRPASGRGDRDFNIKTNNSKSDKERLLKERRSA